MWETQVQWVGKIPWMKEWQRPPIFLAGKFHRQRSLAGYHSWGRKELDTTEWLTLSLFHRYAIHGHTWTHMYTHTCMHVYLYVCTYLYMCTLCVCLYIYVNLWPICGPPTGLTGTLGSRSSVGNLEVHLSLWKNKERFSRSISGLPPLLDRMSHALLLSELVYDSMQPFYDRIAASYSFSTLSYEFRHFKE